MDRLAIFLIYGISSFLRVGGLSDQYILINITLPWPQARQFCRQILLDLATVGSLSDVTRMPAITSDAAWIGLSDDPASWFQVMGNDCNSWRWSVTDRSSPGGFQNWAPGEPNYFRASEECVAIWNGSWVDLSCATARGFVCYNVTDLGQKQFFFISSPLSWNLSRAYCRANFIELATIETVNEHDKVHSLTQNSSAWIGLYRKPWRWSDDRALSFTNWNDNLDNYWTNEHCGVMFQSKKWGDTGCDSRYPFICQGEAKKVSNMKIELWTGADLSDPTVSAQIIKQLNTKLSNAAPPLNLTWSTPPQKPRHAIGGL